MSEEKTIWEGSSSQVLNLPIFLLCGLIFGILLGLAIFLGQHAGPVVPFVLGSLAVLPLLFAIYRALKIKCRHYQITTERLTIRQGILSKRTDQVELYRVRDYVLMEPFALRFFGLCDLQLPTDDTVNPLVTLQAIPGGQQLKDEIRKHVEVCRDKKRVRVTEWEGDQIPPHS